MLNIICEIANGYYGDLQLSKKYIDMAAKAKVNAIKFQIAYPEDILHSKDKIFKILKNNEMSLNKWIRLRNYARKNKVKFYLDIDGEKAFYLAKKLNPDALKISTTSFFDRRLIDRCLFTFKKVYISISGIREEEINELYNYLLLKKKIKKVTFLFGHQNVPTKIENTNLSRLINLKKKYKYMNIGFMDHTCGSSPYKYSLSVFALGLGINCFEKHMTYSKKKKLIDSTSALDGNEFKKYVKTLHDHVKSLGKYQSKLTKYEQMYRVGALTVVHSRTTINKNQKIKYDHITLKRPLNLGNQHIYNPFHVIGKISKNKIKIDEPIKLNNLK